MWFILGIIVGFVLGVITHLSILKYQSNSAAEKLSDNISDGKETISETLDRLLEESKNGIDNGGTSNMPGHSNPPPPPDKYKIYAQPMPDLKNKEETEYRILSHKNYMYEKWLQYKDGNGDWRFIATEMTIEVLSVNDKCPKDIKDCSNNQIGCYASNDKKLREFPKKWPVIEDYFIHYTKLHYEYKKEQAAKKAKDGEIENL